MKTSEAYSRGYRDCATLYRGTGKWWIYLIIGLAIFLGMQLGFTIAYLYFVGV